MDENGEKLLRAALVGNKDTVSELLSGAKDSIDVNYQNADGWSPLHVAACKGHANIVRLLQQAGADLAPRTKFGFTPLHWAAYRGQRECVMLLLLHGAEIDIPYPNNWSPLHWASAKGREDVVKFLLECGAETDLKDNKGQTPKDVSDEYHKEIKTLCDKFRKQEGHEMKRKLFKNAMDSEKWEVATILALNGATTDIDIFNALLYNVLHTENMNVDCIFVLMALLGRDLSSIDNNFKTKMLSAAVQAKDSVGAERLKMAISRELNGEAVQDILSVSTVPSSILIS